MTWTSSRCRKFLASRMTFAPDCPADRCASLDRVLRAATDSAVFPAGGVFDAADTPWRC